ncbi:PKD domain-containing protein [Alienimonas sp. DA493]|uniref:PKD domain-containing protein n=1 Tax=Alienimonas sp. DA493 TaxID=3373605 RepID=UPI003755250B
MSVASLRSCLTAAVAAAGFLLGGSAEAHTVNIAWRAEADGGVTFFAATYHYSSFNTPPPNYGGIILDGNRHDFTGWVVDLPGNTDGQTGWQGGYNDAWTTWQVVKVDGLQSGNHTVTTTSTGYAVEDPWLYYDPPFNITIQVVAQNAAPVADAGADQQVYRDGNGASVATVTLNGGGSSDPDGDALTYAWSAGSGIQFDNSAAASPEATFPHGTHVVTLTVDDGNGGSDTDTVTITVVNREPDAVVGDDLVVYRDGEGATVATVELDGRGSSDPDGDLLDYSWSVDSFDPNASVQIADPTSATTIAEFPLGLHEVTLFVEDDFGGVDFATFTVEVVNHPPTANAGPDQEVHCDAGAGGATVTLDGGGSSDPDDDDLTYKWSVAEDMGVVIDHPEAASTTAFFPVGQYEVTLTVDDGNGGIDTDYVTVTVVDDEAPVASVTTDVGTLWSPNHKMVPVTIVVQASDHCWAPEDLTVLCDLKSSQPDDSDGSGEHVGDVNGEDGYSSSVPVVLTHEGDGIYAATVELRAERNGGDKAGRTYSVCVTAVDGAGNMTPASTCVVVPHDRRKK